MVKLIAKGKKRRELIEADEEALKEFEKANVAPVVKREPKERQAVDSHELLNVMRYTFDRLFQEFDPKMGDRERAVNADERATQTLRVIKHGIPESPGHGARIVEEEQEAPLCRNCQ